MRAIYFIVFVSLIACSEQKTASDVSQKILQPSFQNILDALNLRGAILIYNIDVDIYYSNDFEYSDRGHLPASTFKIPNSIIALETEVVEHDSTIFKWDGERRYLPSWEQDLRLEQAYHYSCVPCYQDVARRIGSERMNDYLDRLDYGDINMDSTNIDMFWLQGDSRISQFQQVDFLKRLYQSDLPISGRTEKIMKRMMIMDANGPEILRGKTGWSTTDDIDNGWFVGYLETGGNTYIFATNFEPGDQFDMKQFGMIRRMVTEAAFMVMGIVE